MQPEHLPDGSSLSTGDYDGALSVFTDMQLLCQEKGLQLAGSNSPVGEEPWRPGGPAGQGQQ